MSPDRSKEGGEKEKLATDERERTHRRRKREDKTKRDSPVKVSGQSKVRDAEMTSRTEKEVIGFDISMDVSQPRRGRGGKSQ